MIYNFEGSTIFNIFIKKMETNLFDYYFVTLEYKIRKKINKNQINKKKLDLNQKNSK